MRPKPAAGKSAPPREGDLYFANYADYSRTMRAWLVAYGIGGPVLFLTNDKVSAKLGQSGHAHLVVSLFLLGVGVQVFGAFVNKWAAWHQYRGNEEPDFCTRRSYRAWSWVNDQTWLDVCIDVGTMVVFGWGTWLLLGLFAVAIEPAAG